MEEVLEFIELIQKSSSSLLELADEILSRENEASDPGEKPSSSAGKHDFTLHQFRDKLLKLYTPQAMAKGVDFKVRITPGQADFPFSKSKLLQIAGNLISNAIKFTPEKGSVTVDLDLIVQDNAHALKILVADTGVGLTEEEIDAISRGPVDSSTGTKGESGYGFGLPLVSHLVSTLKGSLKISSVLGEGAIFEIFLPLKK